MTFTPVKIPADSQGALGALPIDRIGMAMEAILIVLLAFMPLALGVVAHGAVLTALGQRKSLFKFAHGAQHQLPSGLVLADSYHCSRYNTNTRRLTVDMFESVFEGLAGLLPRS